MGRHDKGASISNRACLKDGMGKRKVASINRSSYDLIAVRSNPQKFKQHVKNDSLSSTSKKWMPKYPTATSDLRQ